MTDDPKAAKRAAALALKERLGEGRLIPEKRKAFTPAQKVAILTKSDGLCADCGGSLGLRYEWDHIKPRNWGGETTVENGQVLCKPCHVEKCKREAPEHASIRRIEDRILNGPKPAKLKSGGKLQGRSFDKTRTRGFDGKVRLR